MRACTASTSRRSRRAAAAAALRVSAQVRTGEERPARGVQREQAVPEDGGADARDLAGARARAGEGAVHRRRHRLHEGVGVEHHRAVRRRVRGVGDAALGAGQGARVGVEARRPRRAGADVERHDEHG